MKGKFHDFNKTIKTQAARFYLPIVVYDFYPFPSTVYPRKCVLFVFQTAPFTIRAKILALYKAMSSMRLHYCVSEEKIYDACWPVCL